MATAKVSGRRRHTANRRHNFASSRATLIALVALLFVLIIYIIARPRPGQLIPDLGNRHIQPPAKAVYNSTPPTSGPHYDGLAPWGIHDKPIPNELQVHNLEDGGVMVQYNCEDNCEELVSQLTSIVEQYDHQVILAPYPEMESRIALTAWNRLEVLETFEEDVVVRFINTYRGLDHHE